jgi:chemotaxis protein histidine kinase CheA
MSPDRWHIPTSEEEIVDVFLEEIGELLENIDNHMKTWMNHPEDKKTLTEIRRSFHTLKGSGRMVKALDLSEMAWKVEKALNQAIAGTVPVSEPLVKLVAAVRAQIPRMVDAFKNRRSIAGNRDIERLMKLADALAAGRKPAQAPASLAATAIRGKQHPKLYELNFKLERVMQRTDEALHRSEMALQQARRISTLSEAPHRTVGQRDCCAEVDRIGERVNLLSKEVSEVRLESKKSQTEPILHQSEMKRLVEQRVRARMVPMERLRSDIKQDIEENRRAVTALRRFGWLALILSALVGGVIATGLLMSILSLG